MIELFYIGMPVVWTDGPPNGKTRSREETRNQSTNPSTDDKDILLRPNTLTRHLNRKTVWNSTCKKIKIIYTLLISLGAILNFHDVIRGKIIYTWPKWIPKMKALLTLLLQCVHIKRNVFTSYQEEYFLYTIMPLWVCYRNSL